MPDDTYLFFPFLLSFSFFSLLVAVGLLSPLLFGAITSFFFALSYSTADKSMTEVEGMIWGCGLTFACMFGGSQSYMGFM